MIDSIKKLFCKKKMKNFATKSEGQKRPFDENLSEEDTFCEDRMRVISSNSFKRLEAKTQVFPSYHGDHYRKRLTHSLEVAEIAKKIARKLGVNQDLAEVIALSHDIGHPPFGHVGEDILSEIMVSKGGDYKHNTFSFKIVTQLENISSKFSGLNLSFASLDGILKHNGPLKNPCQYILDYNAALPEDFRLDLKNHAGIEAQIAAIADDIAYINHDIEDGIRAEILKIEDVRRLPLWHEALEKIEGNYSFLEVGIMAKDAKSVIINEMIADLCEQTEKNLDIYKIGNDSDIRNCGIQIVNFSEKMSKDVGIIRKFLYKNLYYSVKVAKSRKTADKIIRTIFETLEKKPELMTPLWLLQYEKTKKKIEKTGIICDYIAGMTDTFARQLAKKFSSKSFII